LETDEDGAAGLEEVVGDVESVEQPALVVGELLGQRAAALDLGHGVVVRQIEAVAVERHAVTRQGVADEPLVRHREDPTHVEAHGVDRATEDRDGRGRRGSGGGRAVSIVLRDSHVCPHRYLNAGRCHVGGGGDPPRSFRRMLCTLAL
jgi:hypothetical protein